MLPVLKKSGGITDPDDIRLCIDFLKDQRENEEFEVHTSPDIINVRKNKREENI
jgi:hypothetical protein